MQKRQESWTEIKQYNASSQWRQKILQLHCHSQLGVQSGSRAGQNLLDERDIDGETKEFINDNNNNYNTDGFQK